MAKAMLFDLDGTLLDVEASKMASRAVKRPKGSQDVRIESGCAIGVPDVSQMLQELRQRGWSLGMISNGGKERQWRKLNELGISQAFDVVVVSGGVALRKPDPRIFELAACEMGVKASDAWFVGNDPVDDIEGAQRAGMKSIWVSGGRPWLFTERRPPTLIVDRIGLIPSCVERYE